MPWGTLAGEGRVGVREALYILSWTYFSHRRRQWVPGGHSQVKVVLVSEKHYISRVGLTFLTEGANVSWGTLTCEGRVGVREALYIMSGTYFSHRRRQRALWDTRR